MKKFDSVKSKYLALGVSEDNIDYAIEAVIDGGKREHILESLTADYRGMSETQSSQMLGDLFEANGGEFKKENQGGYLNGIFLSLFGGLGLVCLILMLVWGEFKFKFALLAFGVAVFGLIKGPMIILKSLKGNYREEDDPL